MEAALTWEELEARTTELLELQRSLLELYHELEPSDALDAFLDLKERLIELKRDYEVWQLSSTFHEPGPAVDENSMEYRPPMYLYHDQQCYDEDIGDEQGVREAEDDRSDAELLNAKVDEIIRQFDEDEDDPDPWDRDGPTA